MIIAGIDEAGRGPLAGPVTAAAVILSDNFDISILNDSKKLSEKKRKEIDKIIRKYAIALSLGWVWSSEIDKINIHNASLLAMTRAVDKLAVEAQIYMVDGKYIPSLGKNNAEVRAIIKGDSLVPEIMAASIVAKTARDKWMVEYSHTNPEWKFEKHKGYPTREHANLIRKYGFSKIHRKTFNVPYGS